MNDQANLTDRDNGLRITFRLRTVQCEPNPPPVDTVLLERLLGADDIDQDDFELVAGFFEKYENWREEFWLLAETKRQQKLSRPSLPAGP